MVAAGLASASSAAEAQSAYQFFARASHLEPGQYWSTGSLHGSGPKLDMGVVRWDNNALEWTQCNGLESCSTNEGRLAWGQPVYAPADGEITSCYRTFPDNPQPGVKLSTVDDDDVPGKPNPGIHAAGNNVWLRTTGGDMIALTHMIEDSIPEELCPNGDSNDPDDDAVDLDTMTGKYVSALYVPPAQRVQVKRGQFIGLVGNSGNSTGPHIHIQYNAIVNGDEPGAARPVRFKQVYGQDYISNHHALWDAWYPLRGEEITVERGRVLVHPAPMLHRASYGAGSVSEVAATFLDDSLAVTAVRNGSGNLQLTSWNASVSWISRLHDHVAGGATQIKVVRMLDDLVLVGLRTSGGALKLILFRVDASGEFTRLDDYTAGSITQLDMVAHKDGGAVTAARDGNGNLSLAEWGIVRRVGVGDWNIILRGTRTEGPVSALAIAKASNFVGVAVAVRTGGGTLRAIPYNLSDPGVFDRGTSIETGKAILSDVDITSIPRGFVAAARDTQGRLSLVSFWAIAPGDLYAIAGEASAGAASQIDITRTTYAGADVITTVRDGAGNMLSISWAMTDTGHSIRRGGAVLRDSVTRIATAPTVRIAGGGGARDMLLTAVRNAAGNLQLRYWDVDLQD